jgi:hypothetical protein
LSELRACTFSSADAAKATSVLYYPWQPSPDKPPLIASKATTIKPICKQFAFMGCPPYALRAAGFSAGFFKAVLTIISEE